MGQSVRTLVVSVCLVLVVAASAFAQGEAVITGVVADASGGVLPGVTITATHTASGQTLLRKDGHTFAWYRDAMFDLDSRLRDMDRQGVDMRILSLSTPNVYEWHGARQVTFDFLRCCFHLRHKLHLLDMPKHTAHSQHTFPDHLDDDSTDDGHGSEASVDTDLFLLGTAQWLLS